MRCDRDGDDEMDREPGWLARASAADRLQVRPAPDEYEEREVKRDTMGGALYGLMGAWAMTCLSLPLAFWLNLPAAMWGTTVIGLMPICVLVGVLFAPENHKRRKASGRR